MLERTAGCLESGSLRRLLPASRKSLKSCRTLHSGFWAHGGGDIELSPFWAALVRAAAPAEQQDEPPTARSLPGHTGVFLDFLYPAGTLNFLRQYSICGTDRSDVRWARHGVARIGQRQYTSSAKDNTSGLDSIPSTMQLDGEDTKVSADESNIESLLKTMGLARSTDFEEAWRQFGLLSVQDQDSLRAQLMIYLSSSDRHIDAGRVVELFEALREEQRTGIIYRAAIRSLLTHDDLAGAMRLYTMALEKLKVPAGSEQILAYHFEHASWTDAMSLYEDVTAFESHVAGRPSYDIYTVLNEHHKLARHALELAKYTDRSIKDGSSEEMNARLLNFSSKIVRLALFTPTNFSPTRFQSILRVLHKWKLDTPSLYDDAMNMLLRLGQEKLALECYRKARFGGIKFSIQKLEEILGIYCQDHSVPGMKIVLDDFFQMHGRPSGRAYGLCMKEFAAKGDSRTVHALWEQYVSRFTDESPEIGLSTNDFAPVLHVHAVRGELQEVIQWFNKMRDVYHLYPTALCWNILLNAYGKVKDFEGAYSCFQELLNDRYCQPTHYTIGTMMGICTQQGDIDRIVELYMLAQNLGIKTSSAMLDNLVLAHVQDDDVEEAEKICEQGLAMKLIGYKTRMWNYLIVAYAQRRDLNNVNRILHRMSEASINNDQYTYSALMQALCMVKQPDRAWQILREVMPSAGIKATSFHYAVVMGGFIGNGEPHKAFKLQSTMWQKGLNSSGSTKLLAVKARLAEDEKIILDGTSEEIFQGALEMFREAMQTMAIEHIVAVPKKSVARYPIDIAYPTMFYNYVMHILATASDTAAVDQLYDEYLSFLPESRQEHSPLQIMSALMLAKHQAGDFDSVEECWRLSLAQAKNQGRPLAPIATGSTDQDECPPLVPHKIVPLHQLDLSRHLYIYLDSLSAQNRIETMVTTVNELLSSGFRLDNRTWNHYIQLLAQKYRYKIAFKSCEDHLMDNWTGWQAIRWEAAVRNRLPFDLRMTRKQARHLRPIHITLLYLARSLLDIQGMAAESRHSEVLLEDIRNACPRVVKAIETMPRTDTALERQILREI